jgi:hypothetical protein
MMSTHVRAGGAGVGVDVGVGVGDGVGVEVAVAVGVGVSVAVGVAVGVSVGVTDAVSVGTSVGGGPTRLQAALSHAASSASQIFSSVRLRTVIGGMQINADLLCLTG